MPNNAITAIVAELSVDSASGVNRRRISCGGNESIDEFRERIQKALTELLDHREAQAMNRGDAQRELFQASRTLNKARAAVLEAGPDAPMEARETLMRAYNAATRGLMEAAVRFTGARMEEHRQNVFAKLFPGRDGFDVVDGIPVIKEPPP